MKEETTENLIAASIVLILCLGAGWWIYQQMYAPPKQPDVYASIPISASPLLGNENATMTVVLFSDFECPYCGQFARDTFPEIKAKYIDTGRVRFVYKQFPLDTHEYAHIAAQASLCAHDQDAFWAYHDVLYAHQSALAIDDLEGYAVTLGLDSKEFNTCLASGQHEVDITIDKALGKKSSVTGTPTFFFNGRRVVGALTAQEFDAAMAQP